MMTAEDVVAAHEALLRQGIDYWIGGGWGIDALIGEQTRDHDDLDISIPSGSLEAVLALLDEMGFRPHTNWLPTRIAMRDAAGREIDVHPLVFAADGSAWLPGVDGGRFDYPADSFTTGSIADRSVPCISASLQQIFHSGYELADKDVADMAALRTAGLLAEDAP
ncbi:MAG: amino acid transporter [Acidimicrobiia bacterium]|nr:amino acid transporter [Acidimicrobiia bacterium]